MKTSTIKVNRNQYGNLVVKVTGKPSENRGCNDRIVLSFMMDTLDANEGMTIHKDSLFTQNDVDQYIAALDNAAVRFYR